MQEPVHGAHVVAAQNDFWACREGGHSHPVDDDLVYPYVRIHGFDFPFSRAILVYCEPEHCTDPRHVTDGDSFIAVELFVADIHLRWSEIERGVHDFPFVPSRYTEHGYPFNIEYFDAVCSLFRPQVPYTPRPPHAFYPQLIHASTNLTLEIISYSRLYGRVVALDYELREAVPSNTLPTFAMLSTAYLVGELQTRYRRWWIDIDQVVYDRRCSLSRAQEVPMAGETHPRFYSP